MSCFLPEQPAKRWRYLRTVVMTAAGRTASHCAAAVAAAAAAAGGLATGAIVRVILSPCFRISNVYCQRMSPATGRPLHAASAAAAAAAFISIHESPTYRQ